MGDKLSDHDTVRSILLEITNVLKVADRCEVRNRICAMKNRRRITIHGLGSKYLTTEDIAEIKQLACKEFGERLIAVGFTRTFTDPYGFVVGNDLYFDIVR